MVVMHVNDQISIYFNDDKIPPYRMHGKFKASDDEYIYIVGTVGEHIDKEYIIPKNQIKMIEVVERVSEAKRRYDESWG